MDRVETSANSRNIEEARGRDVPLWVKTGPPRRAQPASARPPAADLPAVPTRRVHGAYTVLDSSMAHL